MNQKKARPKPGESQGETFGRLLQPCPVEQTYVGGTQVEIPGKQRFDFFRLEAMPGRPIHFHDSAELLILACSGFTGQHEVRVVLDAHGDRL